MKYEKIKVVMLPTNEKAIIIKEKITNKLKISSLNNPQRWDCQHLYFLSNEEIKEGDWCLVTINGGKNYHVWKYVSHNGKSDYSYIDLRGQIHKWGVKERNKIIATTDESLKIPYDSTTPISKDWGGKLLPRPSNEFLKKYCELGGIDEVLVEYEEYDWNEYTDTYWNSKLKVAPDNTITIKPIKESWNREEVVKLIKEFHNCICDHPARSVNNWIKENL